MCSSYNKLKENKGSDMSVGEKTLIAGGMLIPVVMLYTFEELRAKGIIFCLHCSSW